MKAGDNFEFIELECEFDTIILIAFYQVQIAIQI